MGTTFSNDDTSQTQENPKNGESGPELFQPNALKGGEGAIKKKKKTSLSNSSHKMDTISNP